MEQQQFMTSLFDVKPPPCDTCRYRRACGRERMACGLFAHYVGRKGLASKPDRVPSQEMYERIYDGKDNEEQMAAAIAARDRIRRVSPRSPNWDVVRYVWDQHKAGRTLNSIGDELKKNPSTLRDWTRKIRDGVWFPELTDGRWER